VSKIFEVAAHIYDNSDDYPVCMGQSANEVISCKKKEAQAARKLRGDFLDVLYCWINAVKTAKPERNTKMMRLREASKAVWREFGYDRYCQFITAKTEWHTGRQFGYYQWLRLKGMLTLLESQNHEDVYELMRDLGDRSRCRDDLYKRYGTTFVSDASVAEVLAFKVMKAYNNFHGVDKE